MCNQCKNTDQYQVEQNAIEKVLLHLFKRISKAIRSDIVACEGCKLEPVLEIVKFLPHSVDGFHMSIHLRRQAKHDQVNRNFLQMQKLCTSNNTSYEKSAIFIAFHSLISLCSGSVNTDFVKRYYVWLVMSKDVSKYDRPCGFS